MSNAAVQEILNKVELLSEEEQLDLAKRLAERSEADWRAEAEVARCAAQQRGLDQSAIDRAVEEVRYQG
jgi:hypothetical protein